MHRVSISYRRNDTAREAHVLKTVLEDRLRNTSVLVDTEDIPPGSRWPERLEKELNRSTAVIVLIGPDWREAPDVPDALERDQDRVRHLSAGERTIDTPRIMH